LICHGFFAAHAIESATRHATCAQPLSLAMIARVVEPLRVSTGRVLFAWLLLASSPEPAAMTPAERADLTKATAECRLADEHAVAMRWHDALPIYEHAMRTLMALPLEPSQRAAAWECAMRWAAAAGENGKDVDEASGYAWAIGLDPARTPDQRRFSPRILAAFEKAKSKQAKQRPGALTVTGAPAGAEVWLDARFVGRLPLSLSAIAPGKHALLVRLEGHESFAGPVLVRAEDTYRAEIFLKGRGQPEPSNRPITVVVPAAQAQAVASAPAVALSTPSLRPRVHPGASWLPLGIAQFLEHRPVAGGLLLASQVALLGVNLAMYGLTLSDKRKDGYYSNPQRSTATKWVVNASFIVLAVDVLAGGIDGIVHRND
jgi:hypothetical protein